jgi:hypothetical protein
MELQRVCGIPGYLLGYSGSVPPYNRIWELKISNLLTAGMFSCILNSSPVQTRVTMPPPKPRQL